MSDYGIRLTDRAGSVQAEQPRFRLEVQQYSWHARGGPQTAEVKVYGRPDAMRELLDWLRYNVTIYRPDGQAAWWGYVSSVQFSGASVQSTADLERMANRVATLYTDQDSCLGENIPIVTAWAEDAASIAKYGIKERLHNLESSSRERAEAARDRALERWAKPFGPQDQSDVDAGIGMLTCQGFYETLGWQYYTNRISWPTETSIQLQDIAESGQDIDGVLVRDRSNIYSSEYRDGDVSALKELEPLLDDGVLNGRRYLAMVDINRKMLIYQEPANTDPKAQIGIDQDGILKNANTQRRLPDGWCQAGVWLNWIASAPEIVPVAEAATDLPCLIEQLTVDCRSGKYRWTPRGMVDPFRDPTPVTEG